MYTDIASSSLRELNAFARATSATLFMKRGTAYSDKEKEEIIRDYFGPPGTEENPRCPTCGEVLRLDGLHDSGSGQFRIEVSCPDCKASFSWQQNYLQQPWKNLHLQYFVERYTTHEPIRCPLDDCYVIYTEFTDRIVEFRCPYCNHRGKAQLPEPSPEDS